MLDKLLDANFEKVPLGMSAALIFIIVVALLVLWNIQRDKDNQVDIKDLICRNGKIDEGKFMRFTAFVVSTWGFVYLIVDQRFSEWYFTGYIAAWAGNALVGKYLALRAGNIDSTTPPANNNKSTNAARLASQRSEPVL